VRCTEKAFELSEADQHAGDDGAAHPRLPRHGRVRRQGQQATRHFAQSAARQSGPAQLRPHLPSASTYAHEKVKVEVRQPAAERFIVEHGLNELIPGERSDLGIIMQGGITNVALRGLDRLEIEAGSRSWS